MKQSDLPEQGALVEEQETSLLDVALMLKQDWRILIFTPLVTGLIALASAFAMKPTYTATTQLLVPQQAQNAAQMMLGSLGGLGSALGSSLVGAKNPADQWIGMLKSRTIADELVGRFKLVDYYQTEYQFQAVDRLAAMTRVTSGKEGFISIEVDDHDPKRAADMAAAYVQQLQAMSKTLAVTEAGQRRVFFESQLKDAKDDLVKAEVALNEAGISPSVLRTSPDASVTEIGRIKAQVAAQEVKVAVMRGALTDASPELQQALRELASLQDQLAGAAQQDPSANAGSGPKYVGRYRDFKYAETMYELLAKQFELAKIDEANNGAVIQVVDKAQVPQWKSGPKRGLITVLGAFFGLVAAILFTSVRKTIRDNKNPETAEKLARLLGRRPGNSV